MRKIWMLAGMCFLTAVLSLTARPATLKLATMAPDGSIWMKALDEAKANIEEATRGDVKIKLYPGGIMGEERDVLFKIKTGQIHGGGFMGYAIGQICPDSAALTYPMVFRSTDEVDAIFPKMRPILEENSRQNGFVALGWTEVGFTYAYSTKDISSMDSLRATKVWGIASAQFQEMFRLVKLNVIPANITDVLTALQTGTLETVFSPPTAAVVMQWHTKVKQMNQMQLNYAFGGVFVADKAWNTLSEEQQNIVRSEFDAACKKLTPQVRKSDMEAIKLMSDKGVTLVKPTEILRDEFEDIARQALPVALGSVFSHESWNALQGFVAEYRTP